jgi:hypothetical protein
MKKKTLAQAIKAELDRRDPVTYCFIYEALERLSAGVVEDREKILASEEWKGSLIAPEAWIRSAEGIQKLIKSL